MEPQESLDEFSIRFVHYCFEFPERDVDWKCLSEQFKYVILVSLEQFQLDPSVPYDDPQVTGCSNFVPNAVLSISPSPDHIQSSKDSISMCEILAPPPKLSDSQGTTSKFLSNDGWVHGVEAYGTPFEYFMHHVES